MSPLLIIAGVSKGAQQVQIAVDVLQSLIPATGETEGGREFRADVIRCRYTSLGERKVAKQEAMAEERVARGSDHFCAKWREELTDGNQHSIADRQCEGQVRLRQVILVLGLTSSADLAGRISRQAVGVDVGHVGTIHLLDRKADVEFLLGVVNRF